MTDELKQWEYDKGYAKGQIDILEKIKAEIEAERDKLKMKNFNVITGMEVGIDIIDNYISELKGENNETNN